MLKRTLAVCLLALLQCSTAAARVHWRHHRPHTVKNFPATHDSLRLENESADKMGVVRYLTERDMEADIERGVLIFINSYPSLHVSPKLPHSRTYARTEAVAFIQMLSSEFYFASGHALTLDSAVRPASTQKWLRRHNRNAAPVDGARASTHERGTTLDISRHMSKSEYKWLVTRLFYYRETGRILVIEERACFHLFIEKPEQKLLEAPKENIDVYLNDADISY